MSADRFSPFERLLLESRHPPDTAACLLLAWVMTQRGPIGQVEHAALEALTQRHRHGHDLTVLLSIAADQDLDAIQLACELLSRHQAELDGDAFLRQAIRLASPAKPPTLAQQHLLGFLADLLGVAPHDFSPLFASLTGTPWRAPADPSRQAFWGPQPQHSEEGHAQADPSSSQRSALIAWMRRWLAELAGAWPRWREARHQQGNAKRERTRQEQAQREQHHQRQENKAGGSAHRERHEQHETSDEQPPGGVRTRQALAVLGLTPGASRSEIRKAYRRLAQVHHPDRFHHQGDAVVARASRRFQRIRSAYDHLTRAA
ncbi:J domain-containing protein [Halomonas urumqiensis]|uniref:Molecular chaperone DnaJ n=1 Tax=Halomonas urumqiensis TaxID=1684789 RepID=A0A2N7UDA9_9GAMM|nr:J domain-containing protein [Halomonas urumqiensis]PMR78407.1 molecular chaperone DnaJ [Halomonas urumqiensis]PTB03553.1 J domain-containing protein [Halomonas urumqiensis]GHE20245.1 hypothetical protein GCM10017767_07660 [Halomonas urumqiensis]